MWSSLWCVLRWQVRTVLRTSARFVVGGSSAVASRRQQPSPAHLLDGSGRVSGVYRHQPSPDVRDGGEGRVVVGDVVVAEVAARQHGVVSTAQLRAAGLDGSAVRRRVRAGRLHRLHRGVFAVGHTAPLPWTREAAALLACGPGATLSHHSAARLWGVLTDGRPRPVNVIVPRERRPAHEGITVHRPQRLSVTEVRRREGLRVTSPLRTLTDLATTARRASNER